MSENENQPSPPSKQTSSVPLKKETVRVTLKAADAPAVPSASVPMAPPVRPPVPTAPPVAGGAPRPPAPAPTIPLRPAGAPTVGAPAVGAPTAMTPAPTIRLATAAPAGPKLPGAGSPSPMALPKATVQLQPPTSLGSPMSTPSQLATVQDDDDDDERGEGLANILSIVGFVAALIVLVLQLMTANAWIGAEDNPQKGSWSQLMD